MKKLTAEKCREHIARLKRYEMESLYQFPFEIDMREAFEIALPILEQQERGCQKCGGTGEMDSGGTQPWGDQILVECDCQFEQQERGDGWIEWSGGKRPVLSGKQVEVKFRGGEGCIALSGELDWRDTESCGDIIAYRIIPEQPTNQNGEQ